MTICRYYSSFNIWLAHVFPLDEFKSNGAGSELFDDPASVEMLAFPSNILWSTMLTDEVSLLHGGKSMIQMIYSEKGNEKRCSTFTTSGPITTVLLRT